jgi:hypothetical protein
MIATIMGGYNPTRRNRNIGTSKSGRGQDNRMTIPRVAHGQNDFWERIENARLVTRAISGRIMKFFVQPTLEDFVFACTVDDIVRMLSLLPLKDWDGVEAILLRQPRRKEQTLAPVWGRLVYAAQLVNKRGNIVFQGPVIVIEGVNPSQSLKYGSSNSPEDLTELERLKADGHRMRPGGRLDSTVESCRATQLYRTLPHEVGHWVDFLDNVERPSASAESNGIPDVYEKLLNHFHNRPSREKEQFAHSYAQRIRQRLLAAQQIPFERQLDQKQIEHDGLRLKDFESFT